MGRETSTQQAKVQVHLKLKLCQKVVLELYEKSTAAGLPPAQRVKHRRLYKSGDGQCATAVLLL